VNKLLLILFLNICYSTLVAQDLSSLIDTKAKAIQDKLVTCRRQIHQHPELGNREFKTAAFIADYLKKLGLEVQTGVAKTGVVALLKGGKPGPVIGLRADIDALPVYERNGLPFASKDSTMYNGAMVPVMHACGHDSHIAILLGTAEILVQLKKQISGTVKFIFQPAEEGPPQGEEGGAPLMVKEGVMDNPKIDAIFGLHISSAINIGEIKYKSGAMMAAADFFTIKVKGKGSHGSQPWAGVDPIVVASQIVMGLQTVVSRQSELTKAPVVITVGKIQSGVRNNIIPEEAEMIGTIRTLDSKMQEQVHEDMKRTITKIAEASEATATIQIDTRALVTYNTPELVEKMLPSLAKATGSKDKLQIMDWVTGAEDFSYYGQKAPAFYFYLGGKPLDVPKEKAAPHHTPDFYIDDSMLYVGVKAFCNLVFDYPKATKK
jgi:amidohydrolase